MMTQWMMQLQHKQIHLPFSAKRKHSPSNLKPNSALEILQTQSTQDPRAKLTKILAKEQAVPQDVSGLVSLQRLRQKILQIRNHCLFRIVNRSRCIITDTSDWSNRFWDSPTFHKMSAVLSSSRASVPNPKEAKNHQLKKWHSISLDSTRKTQT